MTESMVERVAAAIHRGRNGAGCTPWHRLTKAHKTPYLEDAENALFAAREPMPTMAAAGTRDHMLESDAEYAWKAMIDSALGQKDTP